MNNPSKTKHGLDVLHTSSLPLLQPGRPFLTDCSWLQMQMWSHDDGLSWTTPTVLRCAIQIEAHPRRFSSLFGQHSGPFPFLSVAFRHCAQLLDRIHAFITLSSAPIWAHLCSNLAHSFPPEKNLGGLIGPSVGIQAKDGNYTDVAEFSIAKFKFCGGNAQENRKRGYKRFNT